MRRFVILLAFALLVGASLGVGVSQETRAAKDFRISLSVSPFAESLFRNGIAFTDGKVTAKNPEELQRLFADHGGNEVYARIATMQKYTVGSGDHSMDRAMERARIAKSLSLPFNPELGLFNIYGGARCQ